MYKWKDNSELDREEVEYHNVVWTELTLNKWLPRVWIRTNYFQSHVFMSGADDRLPAWWKHDMNNSGQQPLKKCGRETAEIWTGKLQEYGLRNFRLPPQCNWNLRSSELLRRVGWFGNRPFTCKGQGIQEERLSSWRWVYTASQNVGYKPTYVAKQSREEKRRALNILLTWPELTQHRCLPHPRSPLIQAAMEKYLQ